MWFKKDDSNISAEFTVEKSLIKRLSAPIFSIAKVAPREDLKNVLMKVDNGILKFIATDGRRILSMHGKMMGPPNPAKFSLVVPFDVIRQLANIDLSVGYKTVQLSIGNNVISFKFDSIDARSKYLNVNTLPELETFIPAASGIQTVVHKKKMFEAIEKAAPLADDAHGIKIEIFNDKMTFFPPQNQKDAIKTIDVQYAGKPLTVILDINYLKEFLESVTVNDSVILDFPPLAGAPASQLVSRGEDYAFVLLCQWRSDSKE
ncbi:MAG: hypothetical protein HQL24_04280 [Candidatus Omnitrophica bacterium]|nr:hypothetical protein [Candidatus Omnitrophota bacterium]